MRPVAYFYTLAFASVPRCLKRLGKIVGYAKKLSRYFRFLGSHSIRGFRSASFRLNPQNACDSIFFRSRELIHS